MALDFPSSPTVGQQYLNWTWNGVAWVVTPGPPLASLAQMAQNAGRNYLDNALFNIQQRGVGPWTSVGYTADRWAIGVNIDTVSASIVALTDADRAAIGDEDAIPSLEISFTGSSSTGAGTNPYQRIEEARRLSNKQVTASFWAKAISGTPRVGISIYQNFGTGGSAPVIAPVGTTAPLSNTWQRYTVSGLVPSTIGKTFGTTSSWNQFTLVLSDASNGYQTGVGIQSGVVQFWGMQLEVGSQATPLEKLVPEVDLARCQRFYQTGQISSWAYGAAGGLAATSNMLPVTMRAAPTVTPTFTSVANITGQTMAPFSNFAIQMAGNVTAAGSYSFVGTYNASADL